MPKLGVPSQLLLCGPDVRFGSKADMCSGKRRVRFAPKADIRRGRGVYEIFLVSPKNIWSAILRLTRKVQDCE